HPQQGLPARAGHGALRGHDLRADQPAGRHGVRLRRPAHPLRVSAVDASLARRLARHRGALVGLVILGALVTMALAAPWLSPRDPMKTAPRTALPAPGGAYWLGR